MRSSRQSWLACACVLGAWAVSADAGTARGTFPVYITLANPAFAGSNPAVAGFGFCTSQTLSQATNAIVTVTCAGNQFVSIAPRTGIPFVGTHGGAFRYMLESGGVTEPADPLWYLGSGTITTLRVYHLDPQERAMEIEVSF